MSDGIGENTFTPRYTQIESSKMVPANKVTTAFRKICQDEEQELIISVASLDSLLGHICQHISLIFYRQLVFPFLSFITGLNVPEVTFVWR